MAYVDYDSLSSNSVRVYCAGLASSYTYSTRTVKYYFNGIYWGEVSLAKGVSSGGYFTATGLNSSTFYRVTATIIEDISGNTLATLTGSNSATFTTPAPASNFTINSFSASQYGTGVKRASCTWSLSGVSTGATWTIEAKTSTGSYYEKASGYVQYGSSCIIDFDSYTMYTLRLTVNDGGVSKTKTTTVSILAPPSFTINSFSASQSGGAGSYNVACTWSVSGASSSAYWQVEAYNNGFWYLKDDGYLQYGSSCVISFDSYKTYSLRLTITDGGTSKTSSTTVTLLPPPATIDTFTLTQSGGNGSHDVSCSWSTTGFSGSAYWTIETTVNGTTYQKASGYLQYGSSAIISFDEFKAYSVKLTVSENGVSKTSTRTITLKPSTPVLIIHPGSITHNSMVVGITELSPEYDYGTTVTYYLHTTSAVSSSTYTKSGSGTLTSGASSGGTYTFTGLNPNTKYYVRAYIGSFTINIANGTTKVAPAPEPEIISFTGHVSSGTSITFNWNYQNFGTNIRFAIDRQISNGYAQLVSDQPAALKTYTRAMGDYGTFTFRLTIYDNEGHSKTATCSVTIIRPDPELGYFYVGEVTGRQAPVEWTVDNDTGSTRVEVRYYKGTPSNYQTGGTKFGTYYSGTDSCTITLPETGTYCVWGCLYDGTSYLGYKAYNNVVVPGPSLNTFTVSILSGKKAACSWTITNNNSTTKVRLYYSTTLPSDPQTEGTLEGTYNYGTYSHEITFTQAGTYYVWICLYEGTTYRGYKIQSHVIIEEDRPETWSWTSDEADAFASHGSVKRLTAARWNAFLTRINETADYCNSTSKVGSGSFMGSDKILYAASFNAVRSTIDSLCTLKSVSGTGLSSVSTGGTIYGSYFTSLSAALNRVIDK